MLLSDSLGKYKNHIANIVIILIFVFIAVNIYKDQAKKIVSLSERREEENKKNKALEEISQLKKKMEALKAAVNNKDVSSAISTFSSIAKKTSVKILSIKPLSGQDGVLYAKYPFDLIVEAGGYHAIGKFISQIENHPDIYTVESLGMQPSLNQETGQVEKVAANLRISTILFKVK